MWPTPIYTHGNQTPLTLPTKPTIEFMEWLGYWVGDGCYENDKDVSFVVCCRDMDLYWRLFKRTLKWFPYVHERKERKGAKEFKATSVVAVRWMRNLGLSKERLPDWIWNLTDTHKASFLRGLFEADGCVYTGEDREGYPTRSLSVTMKSYQLSIEISDILSSLGIVNVTSISKQGYSKVKVSTYSFLDFQRKIGFMSKRKRARLQKAV